MKKNTRKILVAVMLFAMIFTLALPVFAAGESGSGYPVPAVGVKSENLFNP